MKLIELEEPLNANERYLHAVSARLDVLINVVEKLSEVITHQVKPIEKVELVKSEAVVAPNSDVKTVIIPVAPVKRTAKTTKK